MTYFNYDPYFCFQRQKVINYLKAGGLIPKGQAGLGVLERFIYGLTKGLRHPLTKFTKKTITKTTKNSDTGTIKSIKDKILNLKDRLSKTEKEDEKNEINKLIDLYTNELENLKAERNPKTVKTSNTAGKAGNTAGKIIVAEQVGMPTIGFVGDIVSPTGEDEPSHFSQGFYNTPIGRFTSAVGRGVGINWPTNAREAYGNNNSSDNVSFDNLLNVVK